MSELQEIAERIVGRISRTTMITIPHREEIKNLIVREFQPLIEQPGLPFSDSYDADKSAEQASQILALLKERRSTGATNVELSKIGLRFGGRIHELRRAPHFYKISCEKESGRVTRYKLAETDW